MAGIHDARTHARLQSEPNNTDDGTWPSYRRSIATTEEEPAKADADNVDTRNLQDTELEGGRVDNSNIHRAQTMIYHLGVALRDLYTQDQANRDHIEAIKTLRSDYRMRNRELEARLPEKNIKKRVPSWTLAG